MNEIQVEECTCKDTPTYLLMYKTKIDDHAKHDKKHKDGFPNVPKYDIPSVRV